MNNNTRIDVHEFSMKAYEHIDIELWWIGMGRTRWWKRDRHLYFVYPFYFYHPIYIDTFASKVAAIQDKYADASVGNVTGSNAVNVFLGIGVAWTIGT